MKWADKLGAYYKGQKPPAARVGMVIEVFAGEPEELMGVAIRNYMKSSEWFPSVASLSPFVEQARDTADSGSLNQVGAADVARLSQSERDDLDGELIRWERGRWAPGSELGLPPTSAEDMTAAYDLVARRLADG